MTSTAAGGSPTARMVDCATHLEIDGRDQCAHSAVAGLAPQPLGPSQLATVQVGVVDQAHLLGRDVREGADDGNAHDPAGNAAVQLPVHVAGVNEVDVELADQAHELDDAPRRPQRTRAGRRMHPHPCGLDQRGQLCPRVEMDDVALEPAAVQLLDVHQQLVLGAAVTEAGDDVQDPAFGRPRPYSFHRFRRALGPHPALGEEIEADDRLDQTAP